MARTSDALTMRPLKRSPVGVLTEMETAVLGDILEVELHDGTVIEWVRPRPKLLWSPDKSALLMYEGIKSSVRRPIEDAPRRVISIYERWSDWEANDARTLTTDAKGPWRTVGDVHRIDYYSTKWDRPQSYTHKSGPRVRMYRYGQKNGPFIWAIRGGRMTVTERGIVY